MIKKKPRIVLKQESVTLYRDEKFLPKEYIETIEDNYSENLPIETSEFDPHKDRQEIIYKVKDSSNNETSAILVVYLKDRPKPRPNPSVNNLPSSSSITPILGGDLGGNLPQFRKNKISPINNKEYQHIARRNKSTRYMNQEVRSMIQEKQKELHWRFLHGVSELS